MKLFAFYRIQQRSLSSAFEDANRCKFCEHMHYVSVVACLEAKKSAITLGRVLSCTRDDEAWLFGTGKNCKRGCLSVTEFFISLSDPCVTYNLFKLQPV